MCGVAVQCCRGVDAALIPTTGGKIRVITSETTEGGVDNNTALGGKTGYKIKLPIVTGRGRVSLTTTPWYERSEIGHSGTIVNPTLIPDGNHLGEEPDSKTESYGLELMVGVAF